MHRVTLPDGTRRPDRWLRGLRILSYFLITAAGVLLLFSPVLAEAIGVVAYIMSAFIAAGAGLCLYGSISEKWIGEFIGIPLLCSGLSVIAFIQSVSSFHHAPFIAAGNLVLILGVVFSLLGRWREARAVYTIALHLAKKDKKEATGAVGS